MISGSHASLMIDGQSVLQTTYAAPLHDGQIGLGARNSKARFDDWRVL